METPKEKLKRITAWDAEPTLSEDDFEAALAVAAMADSDGLAPSDEDWKPTYDFNAAAAVAWLVKAGRASPLTEIDPPGSGTVTAKVFDNCRAMARIYAAKRTASMSIKTG